MQGQHVTLDQLATVSVAAQGYGPFASVGEGALRGGLNWGAGGWSPETQNYNC